MTAHQLDLFLTATWGDFFAHCLAFVKRVGVSWSYWAVNGTVHGIHVGGGASVVRYGDRRPADTKHVSSGPDSGQLLVQLTESLR